MSDRVKAVLAQIEALSSDERTELSQAMRKSLWAQWRAVATELGREATERGIDDAAITEAVMRSRYGTPGKSG